MQQTGNLSGAIESCGRNVKTLWAKVRCILQPQEITAFQHSADDFAQFFQNKVNVIRASTSMAPHPIIREREIDERLRSFENVTTEEAINVLKRSPAKHCSLDPIPTWMLKKIVDVIAPAIARMCNASIDQYLLPAGQKCAMTHPLLKKSTLDPADLNSYRSISNLNFASKTVERIIDSRLTSHAHKHSLFPTNQSAYRSFHSTETALVCIHNDLIGAMDAGHVGALVLLDLWAAFDTVDHVMTHDGSSGKTIRTGGESL